MAAPKITRVRNIASSRTSTPADTVSERFLFHFRPHPQARRGPRREAQMDWMPQERGARHHHHGGGDHHRLARLRHSPDRHARHVDFTIESSAPLASSTAPSSCSTAVSGRRAQSETVWRQADKFHGRASPSSNKMDRAGATSRRRRGDRTRLGARPIPIQLPIAPRTAFTGVVDRCACARSTSGDETEPRPRTTRPPRWRRGRRRRARS